MRYVPGEQDNDGQIDQVSGKVVSGFHNLCFMLVKDVFSFAEEENGCHIEKMDGSQDEHDGSCFDQNTTEQGFRRFDRLPGAEGHRRISQVDQIITGKQGPVDIIGQFFVVTEEIEYKNTAIPVKDQSHMYRDEPGEQKVEQVGQCVHMLLV